jgi:hypothetical protein
MAQQRNTISSSPRSLRSLRLLIYSTTVENVRQIGRRFFKTKPICRRGKIQVSSVLRKDYEKKARLASQLKQSQTNPIAGLWPEARSTEAQIIDRLAPSTTFRDGPGPRRRAQQEASSLVVMAAKEGGIIYGLWFTEIRHIEGLYAYPHLQDSTLPCGWRAHQLPAQDSVEGGFACQCQNSKAGP